MDWPSDPNLRDLVARLTANVALPRMAVAQRKLAGPAVDDVEGETRRELRRLLQGVSGEGAPIAIGVGSRGITGIAGIVRCVVDELSAAGFTPFIVPAMGSHGGGTPEGQTRVLADFGIDSETMGVPV